MAIERCKEEEWADINMEAQNQLSMWLHLHARQAFQSWNERVIDFRRTLVNPLIEESWRPYQRRHGLDEFFVGNVERIVLSALMENSYLDAGHRCCFFLELLTVMEAGHFPCGWRGAWPEGALIVF